MLELTKLNQQDLTMYIWVLPGSVPTNTKLDFDYSIESSAKKLPQGQNWTFLGAVQAKQLLSFFEPKKPLELKLEPSMVEVKQNVQSFFTGLELMGDKYLESETDKKVLKRLMRKIKV
jgi:hypothetical protein